MIRILAIISAIFLSGFVIVYMGFSGASSLTSTVTFCYSTCQSFSASMQVSTTHRPSIPKEEFQTVSLYNNKL